MPKSQLVLSDFKGGLHTDADPRDIAINQFSVLQQLNISSQGLIKSLGSIATPSEGNLSGVVDITHSINPGYGLFAFDSDYNASGNLIESNYFVFQDGDLTDIYQYNPNTTEWNQGFADMNSGGTNNHDEVKPSFYAPDGDLRVCDTDFTHVYNEPQFVGCQGKKTLASTDVAGNTNNYAGYVAIGTSWQTTSAGIEANPFDNVGDSTNEAGPDANLVMHNSLIDGDDQDLTGGSVDMTNRVLSYMFDGDETMSQATWGLGLDFSEKLTGSSGLYAGDNDTGSWQPESSVKY